MDSSPIPVMRERLRVQVQQALAGRYRIVRELGFGGMAVVYLAENLDFQRMVAIKVMRPEKGYEDGIAERFRTEAVAVAQLRHPHIIGVHARGEEGDILWFEMDFVPGDSLETLLAQGPLAVNRVARYLAQAADALAFAHSQGVVHRDIKPSNLLIDASTDYLVITDFGIAKILGKTSLTETGVTVGTLAYMSPEQLAADRSLTATADQYSLGVVAYECIAGERPFGGDSPGELVVAQATRPAPSLAEVHPDCPPDLAALVQRMLALDPRARWPDLGVVKIAAAEIASTGAAPSLREIPAARSSRRTARRRETVAAIGVVAVVATLAFWLTPTIRAKVLTTVKPPRIAVSVAPVPPPVAGPRPAAAGTTPEPMPPPAQRSGVSRGSALPKDAAPRKESLASALLVPDTTGKAAPPPVPTTATLSITSALPGTFVYVNGSTQPISLSEGFVDLVVPAGRVDLRISSNQPGCTSRVDQLVLQPGERKRVRRNAECPP